MNEDLKKTLDKLSGLADVLSGEPLTKSRFEGELKKVAQYFADFQKKYIAKLVEIQKALDKKLGEIDSNNSNTNEINKADIKAAMAQLESYKANMESVITRKMAEVKDGNDADEDSVVERATEAVRELLASKDIAEMSEKTEQGFLGLGDQIATAYEVLEELKEELGKVDSKIGRAIGSIQVPSPVGWTKHQSIALSSGTTTYSLDDAPAHNGKAAIVRYEGQVLDDTTHYSFNGTDITLTFDPNNGTTLSVMYWPF
jgi:hypothetical protein